MLKIVITLLITIALSSCASTGTLSKEAKKALMNKHVLRLNRDGVFIEPDISSKGYIEKTFTPPLDVFAVEHNLEAMFREAEALADKKAKERKKDSVHEDINQKDQTKKKVKILVHVHGGLNTFSATDDRVLKFVQLMLDETQDKKGNGDWHYPIFISWPSNAPGTWAEGTFRIREGRKANAFIGAIGSPFILAANVLNAVGNYPATLYYQLANEKDRFASGASVTSPVLSQIWKDADEKFCNYYNESSKGQEQECTEVMALASESKSEKFQVNRSAFTRTPLNTAVKGAPEIVTFPVRLTYGTVWNSSIAESAWDIMKRRTQNIFFPPQVFQKSEYANGDDGIHGGTFFQKLIHRAQASDNYEYEITLVGHSMGTIVLNHALVAYKDEWIASGALKNIVYMAAACTINEGIAALTPILENTQADFYNLTLNRVAEVAETHAYGLVPSGSLLVSIDQHHESPEHPLERTLGSEVNVLSTLPILQAAFDRANGQVEFKAFDRYPGYLPEAHGDFSKIEFWKKSTWQVKAEQAKPKKHEGRFNALREVL